MYADQISLMHVICFECYIDVLQTKDKNKLLNKTNNE